MTAPASDAPLLVLGATGNVGASVLEHLLAAGADVHAGVRDPAAAVSRLPTRATAVRLDLTDPSSFAGAVADARDLGELAARMLLDPVSHRGRDYELTGPDALGFADAAATLTHELGRPITNQAVGVLAYARHLQAGGVPAAHVAVQTVLQAGLRFGQGDRVTGELERLLGRAPRSLADDIADHRALWRR